MAGSDASEGQAVWQPGGAEEDSRFREGNRHLHLEYDDEEEKVKKKKEEKNNRKLRWYGRVTRSSGLATTILQGTVQGGR